MELIYWPFIQLARANLLPESFEQLFAIRALIAAILLGPLLGVFGNLVIAQQKIFFSQTLGHAALTGVALGLLIGEPISRPYVGLFGFTLLIGGLMQYLESRIKNSKEVVIGLVLSQVLGLGIILMILVTQRFDVHQVEAILFGSLITIDDLDLGLILIMCLLGISYIWINYNRIILASLDTNISITKRPLSIYQKYLFVFTLTLIIVTSLKLIGALLVLVLLVSPTACAQSISKQLMPCFWLSALFGGISAVSGVLISAHWPIPAGGAIALIAGSLYVLSVVVSLTNS